MFAELLMQCPKKVLKIATVIQAEVFKIKIFM